WCCCYGAPLQPRVCVTLYLFLSCHGAHRDLHSFPTRRSSDLGPTSRMAKRSRHLKKLPRRVGKSAAASRRTRRWSCRSRMRCGRSEEHTSELQSQSNLVCRLLLEKKNEKREARDTMQYGSAAQ